MSKWVNWILGGLALAGVGCSSDNDNNQAAPGRYAMAIIVFSPGAPQGTTYLTSVDSPDVATIDTKNGREFAGQANIASYNGFLYVSRGDRPEIERYVLDANNQLALDTTVPVLSFANFGVPAVSVDVTVNTFVSPTKAYIIGTNGTQVAWNPTTMQLGNVIPPNNLQREGFIDVKSSSAIARGNRLYRVFYWSNLTVQPYKFSDEQLFAVYDTDTDKLISMTPETRCPALGGLAFTDEAGTAYFSNWFYNVPGTLQDGKPPSCMLRLPQNSDTLDPNWAPKFRDLTGGHEGAQLSYAGGRTAIFATLHQEAFQDVKAVTAFQLVSGENWESWAYNLDTGAAKPIAGIARLGAQQTTFRLDGRTFLLAPNKAFSESKGYEIKADGSVAPAFSISGFSRAFVKIK
ncbi:hypothetical protein LVJ94_46525 [Pendulispora rubella]|uniref:Uncharacterized protein n=1 Tax=Pendulispora rubella TaxID=2741070 RepID=A0ABZ2L2Y9_9BACT